MSWKSCNCAMTSRDLLPALRAARDMTISFISTHTKLAQESPTMFMQWARSSITDTRLLAIAERAGADPEQLFYRHPGDERAEGEGAHYSRAVVERKPGEDADASAVGPSPSPASNDRTEPGPGCQCTQCSVLRIGRRVAFARAVAFCEQAANNFDETYADKHADAARYIARGISALAEKGAK